MRTTRFEETELEQDGSCVWVASLRRMLPRFAHLAREIIRISNAAS
jgi:hypothetical protein